jgi:phosphohistidine phosphatase SixA
MIRSVQHHVIKRIAAVLGGIAISFAMATSPHAADQLAGRKLVEALKTGGYIIYFRHFETGADTPDQHLAKYDDCSTQRQLNETGVRDAVRVRDAFVKLGVPVGDVLASPFCRSWQSADLSFGRHRTVDGLKLPPSKDYTDADRATMKAVLIPLLATSPPAGRNLVIMGHDDHMPAAGGPEMKTQGEAVITKPDGKGGFTVVAQVQPWFWRAAAQGRLK